MVSQGNTPTNMMKYGGFAWFNATFILESFGVNWPSKICTWKPWMRTSNHWWWLFFSKVYCWLVVWNMDFFVPFHIWVFILPIHELIFFKMVIAPPTRLDFQSHSTMVSPYGQAVCFWIVLETPSRCFRHHSDWIWLKILNHTIIWVNYNDLTATSLEIMVSKGNHPQMALIQASEIS